jgi:hypothetical protein
MHAVTHFAALMCALTRDRSAVDVTIFPSAASMLRSAVHELESMASSQGLSIEVGEQVCSGAPAHGKQRRAQPRSTARDCRWSIF